MVYHIETSPLKMIWFIGISTTIHEILAMIWFIGISTTIHEILAIKIFKKGRPSRNLTKFVDFKR